MKNKISLKGMIDRLEGGSAVILDDEGETMLELPGKLLPEGAGEGSIIEIRIRVKKNEEKEAKRKVARMIEKLKKTTF